MSKSKIAVSIETSLVARIDQLVGSGRFTNRSQAVQVAIEEKLARLDHARLACECAKLDRAFEGAMAEESATGDLAEWPAY
jgi:Arc/MetJ-type ribon-helix-helix transcriptional regulator